MDAHLFRGFCEALAPLLNGARLEKLQEPAPGLLTLTFFNAGRKRQLCLRFGRKEPFCFLTERRISAGHAPTARIMRLRKYAADRRIAACVAQFCARRLWLLLGNAPSDKHGGAAPGQSLWLLLDLREGPSLHFLEPQDTPAEDRPAWPAPGNLDEACANWRQWPVLTPALRRTLAHLEKPEQWALLEDLRAGGGDIFLYGAPLRKKGGEGGPGQSAPAIRAVSAWPLPPALRQGLEPVCAESEEPGNARAACARPLRAPLETAHGCRILALLERAGQSLVLERLAQENAAAAALPLDRRSRKLARLQCKLDEEEKRLAAMLAAKADALALRENLWRWPADLRVASLSVPADAAGASPEEAARGDGQAPQREIRLDPRRTVREEMEALFHRARRGQRGLEHLAARRAALEEEAAALNRARHERLLGSPGAAAPGDKAQSAGGAAALPRALPKNVQLFVSADGFALLRGRDAKGNLAARKLAAPHDIWLHAENGPGAHVIIRRAHGGQEVPERTLDQAGALAACKSWQREAAKARILYAEVRHVKPLRNAPAGTVRVDKVLSSREVPVDCELETLLLPSF